MSEALAIAVLLVRAEEAWEPVLFGGMIPILGAFAIGFIIYRAVRDNDESDDE
jgi:predicted anti-sigma-YlaC factor YlaD